MQQNSKTWTSDNFSQAMENAIRKHCDAKYLRASQEKILFNGFWRDGDKRNVCLWLDKATWHDAKTGEGGGCKDFAKIAFNMSLPEFMASYGDLKTEISPKLIVDNRAQKSLGRAVQDVWSQLQKRDTDRYDRGGVWLNNDRGFPSPRINVGSGFANLYEGDEELFDKQHQALIKHRVSLGPQLIVPIRSASSDQVKNLFIRATTEISKEEKSRLLTNCGGWHEPNGSPRAFGFPHLIHEFTDLILCEGMADYFAAECLLDPGENFLPIGAANADGLVKWAEELTRINYEGRVLIIYHIDLNQDGSMSSKEIGPAKAIKASQILRQANIDARIFPWPFYLKHTTNHAYKVFDLADSLKQRAISHECNIEHLKEIFSLSLRK